MYDEIKKALKTCISDDSCRDCIFMDDRECNVSVKTAALEAIQNLETTIAYLMDLNNKLSTELKETTRLLEEKHDG